MEFNHPVPSFDNLSIHKHDVLSGQSHQYLSHTDDSHHDNSQRSRSDSLINHSTTQQKSQCTLDDGVSQGKVNLVGGHIN